MGTYASPRRTGYAYNWSLTAVTAGTSYSGSGVGDIISNGMHTGVAGQVPSLDAVLIWVGSNDYAVWNATYDAIYNGTLSGGNLTTKEDSIISNLTTAVSSINSAGTVKILISNIYDIGLSLSATYTNATYRQRVTDSIVRVNTRIQTLIDNNSNAYLMDRYNWTTPLLTTYTLLDGYHFLVGGVDITSLTNDDEPHHFLMADSHYGTVVSGIVANICIITPLRAAGFNVPFLTDAQILKQAGLGTDTSTPSLTTIRIGIIGDSGTDEYQADDNRGGTYHSVTFNPIEMMKNILHNP
jgi:hypothetical protein